MFESIFNLHAWSNLSQFLYWMRNFAQTIKHAVIVYMLFQEKNGVPGSNLKDFSHMRPRRYYNQNNCMHIAEDSISDHRYESPTIF
jgi:hypothetical protein